VIELPEAMWPRSAGNPQQTFGRGPSAGIGTFSPNRRRPTDGSRTLSDCAIFLALFLVQYGARTLAGMAGLDIETLFVTAALAAALSGTLLLIARTGRGIDPLAWWGIAMILGSVGLLLHVAPLPQLLTRDLAKAMLLLTGPASWTAARVFACRAPAPWRFLAGAALWLVLCQIPTFRASEAAQLAVSCAIGSSYMFATAFALHPIRAEALPSFLPALVLLYFHAVFYAARAVMAALGLDRNYDEPLAVAMLLEAQIHTMGMAIVLIAMTKERAEHRLQISLVNARTAGESRARFVAHMSHEVRTPLNGILSVAQLLRIDPTLRADQRDHVGILEAAGQHLLAIVNDALDLAKIDAGRLEIASTPLSPRGVAEDCLTLVRPSAVEKRLSLKLEIEGDVPPAVLGDSTRLRQILLNLAWNAVKFTPPGGLIWLRVSRFDGLCFEIADTGPGVPPEKQPMLFQEFTQLEPQKSGTGLGLSLSARLATQMGGSLCYLPGSGGAGGLFRLTLPWSAGDPARADSEPDGRRPIPEGLNLLVVDDVPANRGLLRAILALDDHKVAEAQSGADAVAMIAHSQFDAVLMDLRMPGMDGIEATRCVRAMSGDIAQVPILGLSAEVIPEVHEACRTAGMDAMLTKPISRKALREALAHVAGDKEDLVNRRRSSSMRIIQ
jgi:signal transduction histidine kinase/CheY-like chemotaxis protein